MIDTHVHLNNDKLFEDVETYIQKALDAGVKKMIVIGYNQRMNERAIELAERYDQIFAAVGLHPTEASSFTNADIEDWQAKISHPKVVAIGECGMDFYWDKTHHDLQEKIFSMQIETAQSRDLPLSIHMRDATEKTYEILKSYAPVKGVMHCYSGSAQMAEKFLKLGLHISLGGPVTFKNAKVPKEVAKIVPLDKLLVETDAPFLAPHPFRGKQNDSSYLPYMIEAIAKEKNLSVDTIKQHTTQNAITLFNLR